MKTLLPTIELEGVVEACQHPLVQAEMEGECRSDQRCMRGEQQIGEGKGLHLFFEDVEVQSELS